MINENKCLTSLFFCIFFFINKMHVSKILIKAYRVYNVRCFTTKTLSSKQSYIHHIGRKPLVYRNIGQELERATSEYGSTEAVVSFHENERRSFTSLLDEVNRLSAGFYQLGLKRGDRVAIWGPNNLHWYVTMLGAARAGMISVGINPAFQAEELEYCLKKVNVNAIVASETFKTQNYYDILASVCPELSHSEPGPIKSEKFPDLKAVIIDTKSQLKGALKFTEVLDLCSAENSEFLAKLQLEISPDSCCNIQFTSGTTGKPKAAMLSHFNFVNNGLHIGERNELFGERICVQVPLFHAYGVVISIMAGMSSGSTLVLPSDGFSPEASLRATIAENCTVIYGTPTMYVELLRTQQELNLPLKSAEKIITAGAPCSPQLYYDMKSILGVKYVRNIYGLTEGTAALFQSQIGDNMDQTLHSVGYLTNHLEAKVVDVNGNTVPLGQPGELCVRGYLTMLGYYDDEAKTKEVIGNDKWLRTGDQFILQEDGYGRIVGRMKEMIIRGGENIFPKEIEDFLNSHPDILESHVIGVPDERLGEEICAFIRLQEGTKGTVTNKSLREYAKGKVAHFKVPRYLVITNEFSKTTSGKIQKFKLVEKFQQGNIGWRRIQKDSGTSNILDTHICKNKTS